MRFYTSNLKPELVATPPKDTARPVLNIVHLNAETSEVWATDSYRALIVPVELDEGDTSGPVPLDALKASRKTPLDRGRNKLDTRILLNGDAKVVMDGGKNLSHSAPYLTVQRASGDYTFPDLPRVYPEGGSFEIGLNAKLLYELAKAMGDDAVVLRFTDKPATDHAGNVQVGPDRTEQVAEIGALKPGESLHGPHGVITRAGYKFHVTSHITSKRDVTAKPEYAALVVFGEKKSYVDHAKEMSDAELNRGKVWADEVSSPEFQQLTAMADALGGTSHSKGAAPNHVAAIYVEVHRRKCGGEIR